MIIRSRRLIHKLVPQFPSLLCSPSMLYKRLPRTYAITYFSSISYLTECTSLLCSRFFCGFDFFAFLRSRKLYMLFIIRSTAAPSVKLCWFLQFDLLQPKHFPSFLLVNLRPIMQPVSLSISMHVSQFTYCRQLKRRRRLSNKYFLSTE